MRVRDPIHGTIAVEPEEKLVIDSRFYQRLRCIRQLGFGELAFPGATHTRHAHSLGAMHVASRLADAALAQAGLPGDVLAYFRRSVRVAVLCHDIGHMPLSHASERVAPELAKLNLPRWLTDGTARTGQASHEDFTAKILLDSSFTDVFERAYAPFGVRPDAVASLIVGVDPPGGSPFIHGGVDYGPLLRALVSGELDADRMDYLVRDSFFTGVKYGHYDLDWIVQNLAMAVRDGKAYLALTNQAAFAFEDFLLSRYHMFVSVYYHHTSVNFDFMLQRFYEEAPDEFQIPADPEAFLSCDDVALMYALRRSQNRWAQRIVTRQGFKLLAQFTERDSGYDLGALSRALEAAGVESFAVESMGVLSKYFGKGEGPPLFIVDTRTGRLTEVAKYTPLYQRYSSAVRLSRAYIRPDQAPEARAVLEQVTAGAGQQRP